MLIENATHLTVNFGAGDIGKAIFTETVTNIMGASLI
jgi:hypothetical protein